MMTSRLFRLTTASCRQTIISRRSYAILASLSDTRLFSTTVNYQGRTMVPNPSQPTTIAATTRVNFAMDNANYYCHSKMPRHYFSSAATVDDNDQDGTIIPFKLADIGEGIKEVELLQWFVSEGDTVQQFDRICEVQSDKATVEITSRYDGVVDHLAGGKVGDMVQVGSPLLLIRVEGEIAGGAASSSDSSSPEPTPAKKSVLHNQDTADQQLRIPHVASQFHLDSDHDFEPRQQQASGKKFLATPAVRKLGMEYNLDLSTLVGTGPQGRVLKSDVLTFLREGGRISSSSSSSSSSAKENAAASSPTSMTTSAAVTTQPQEDETIQLKGYSRLMIQTMTKSQEIPHMGYTDEFNLTKLVEYRKHLSADTKVSILAFFIKATSLALQEYPIVNASFQNVEKGEVTMWGHHNIGVAMDTPRGLVVPVIHHCQSKSLVDIQQDLNDLKEIAAAGKLTEQHLTGATFSISNIGSLGGGTYMNPLIVPPQAAIGAMGSLQTLPRFDGSGEGDDMTVSAAKIMNISWAGDHRMIDGATLARFSNKCKDYLEDPVRMLVAMK